MEVLNKSFFKFTLGFLVIIALSIALLYYVAGPKNNYDERSQQAQEFEELEKAYKNDIYGGDTPEETLQLFIDALKAGDIDLASKYFVIEKQEEKKGELNIGKQNGVLVLLVQDLEKEKFGKELFEGRYRFTTYTKDNITEFGFDLVKNPLTNKWKIESL